MAVCYVRLRNSHQGFYFMEHLLGTEIKGYRLTDLIGMGGFGAVYRAHQDAVEREVAIKIILPENASTPMFIRRFEAEAQLVARLEHPYIVPLYDFWRDPQGAYIVMRYLRGGSLSQLIRENGPLSFSEASRMLTHIAAALTVAHNSGVIHRDLKPDNILLDESRNYYLTDFGIAKDVGKDTKLTQTGTIIGSPAYLSPEQITGESVTPLSDVYSLGILLHYALTGEHPFPGKTPTAMLVHQMQDDMPTLNMHLENVPPLLEDVLQRATAKDPGARYTSALELATEFNRALRSDIGSTSQIQRLNTSEINVIVTSMASDAKNPYKGLKAFEEADSMDFFGRDKLIERLINRLSPKTEFSDGDQILVVVGPSGSGKSSVIKAGLIPRLRRGALPGSENWFYIEMVPGAHPMEEMEAALLRVAVNPPASLLRQLQDDERGLLRAIKRVLPDDSKTELVLVIDQFEEVFTLTTNEAERQHFLNSLLLAVNEPRNRLRLILTLRADFYDRPLSYHAFGELVRQYTEVVLPLSPQELTAAIVQPAQSVGVTLETGLPAAIVADVREQPGALPLLQYALTQLFERCEGNRLTLQAYSEIGGAMGALAKRAEELYDSLTKSEQEVTRQLFLRLVTLGEGTEDTRRRITRTELDALGKPETMRSVIDTFGNQRLLTFDHDPQTREPTIEVAHEALIREWRRLGEWLDNTREDLRTQRRLNSATHEWFMANRDASFLATGTRLEQFETLQRTGEIAINADEAEYLEQSLSQRMKREAEIEAQQVREATLEEQARQRLQMLVTVLAVAALLAVLLAVFAFNAQRQAQQAQVVAEDAAEVARVAAEDAEAVALAASALNRISNYRPSLALNLALEAVDRNPLLTPVQQALAVAAYSPSAVRELNPFPEDSLLSVDFSRDGERMVGAASNGNIVIVDIASVDVLQNIPGRTRTIVNDNGEEIQEPIPMTVATFHPDGDRVATGDDQGMIHVYDANNGESLFEIDAHTQRITGLQFSPNGLYLISGSQDTTMTLWNADNGERIRDYIGHVGAVASVDFSADSARILTTTLDNLEDRSILDRSVRLWDTESGELLRSMREDGTGWLRGAAINPNATFAAVGSFDQNEFGATIRIWDLRTGRVVRRITGHTDVITTIDFNPDGRTIVSGGWDRTARVWDITTGTQIQRFDIHEDRLLDVAFNPDGTQILTTSGRDSGVPDDGRALLTDLRDLSQLHVLRGHEDWVYTVAYDANGSRIATGSGKLEEATGDNTARIWDVATGELLNILEGHENSVGGVVFHPNENWLVTAGWDGQAIIWDLDTNLPLVRITEHEAAVNDVDFNPDGTRLVTGSYDGSIRLWNPVTGDNVWTIDNAHDTRVLRVKFNFDGTRLVSGGNDSLVRVWDASTGEMLYEFEGHEGWVNTVNFSPDGRFVASGADNDLIIWDLMTLENLDDQSDQPPSELSLYRRLVGHSGFVYGGDFSPDGRYLLSGATDTTVRLWEIESGDEIRRFEGHTSWIQDIEFSPDGTQAVSAAEDDTAIIWRIAPSTEDLVEWVQNNRYLPDLSCAERVRYDIEPFCTADEFDQGPGRGRENLAAAID